jgi:hypothetical protein
MTVLQSQLDADTSPSASSAAAQLDQLNSVWQQREATATSLRERAEVLRAHQASLASQVHSLFLAPASSTSAAAISSMHIFQSALTKLAGFLHGLAQAAQQLPQANSLVAASGAASWDSAVFLVKTVHSLLSSCFNSTPDMASSSASELSLTAEDTQRSTAERIMQCLTELLNDWSQAKLLPSLMDHLQPSSASDIATARQGSQDLPNGVGDHLLQGLSDLALEESSGSAGLTSSHGALADVGLGASAPELVPFSDFDTSLEGADQMLEHALEDDLLEQQSDPTDAALEPEHDTNHVLDSSMMAPADLVPFSDFDTALTGADQSLELAGDSLESNSSPDLAHNPTQHAQTSQAERLSLAMQDFVHCAGELTTAEQQQAGVAAALSAIQLSSESWETNEQLAAFEWVHEAQLEAALQPVGGLGQPALIAPKVKLMLAPKIIMMILMKGGRLYNNKSAILVCICLLPGVYTISTYLHAMQPKIRSLLPDGCCHSYHHDILYVGQHVA